MVRGSVDEGAGWSIHLYLSIDGGILRNRNDQSRSPVHGLRKGGCLVGGHASKLEPDLSQLSDIYIGGCVNRWAWNLRQDHAIGILPAHGTLFAGVEFSRVGAGSIIGLHGGRHLHRNDRAVD